MADYTGWFVLALVLVGVELASGTLYMLVIALAVALGGVVAYAGLTPEWQYGVAGVAAIAGTFVLKRVRGTRPSLTPSDNNLDIGQSVKVLQRNADGTARVRYRGAEWDAVIENDIPQQGTLYIRSVQGSTLHLTPIKS